MKNWFLVTFFFLSISSVFAQGKITGKVEDENGPLPGANVVIQGTTNGVATSFDGSFTLNSSKATGTLVVSYLGYESKKVSYSIIGSSSDLGTIVLKAESNVLGEVVVSTTVIDIAKDRKTPVAVSTIKAAEIREKLGSQEFPEILATTPSVYVTKSGGGFGDSRINIRGFDQRNVAVMINGVPVNDMENGAVYWSNWAGLSDVTTAMQVQRGLGSSKLAISSVGGTINVITRSADAKQGGSISSTIGNDNYLKTLASYSTGKMENGLSASILFSNTMGNGYVDGTKFLGQNYFIGLGYEINENHDIQFTFTGAPQWHHQRSFANTLADYIKYGNPSENKPNIKYNSDWGYLNGEEYSWARNFYHKPVASLNYDWKINDKMKLSSVFYGSWGRGGGTGNIGRSPFAFKTANGLVPFNDFYAYNTGTYDPANRDALTAITGPSNLAPTNGEQISSRTAGFTRRASINSHDWYGSVINLNTKLSDKFTLDFGVDARTYIGYHFRNVNDLLGADGYFDNRDINNPNRFLYNTYSASPSFNPFTNVKDQEKIEYNNNGYVKWYGAFTQLEYSTEKLSAFVQGAISQQGFKREDTFLYLKTNDLYMTDYKNILGGNVKGGVNYNINEQMNVFANAGYYSKQPFFNAVYPSNQSIVAADLTNEKILGVELGYGFRSSIFNANLNAYYTSWKDRYQRSSDPSSSNRNGYYEAFGVDEIHQGLELEMTAKPFKTLNINGMVSYGDWFYDGNATYKKYDQNNLLLGDGTLTLDKVKVGDVAQVTYSIGANWEAVKGLKLDANYRYADNLYANIEPGRFSATNNKGTLLLPSYGLMDLGLSLKLNRTKDSKDSFNFRINVNNVLDETFVTESRTNQFTATQAEFDGGTGDGLINPFGSTTSASNKLKGTGSGQYPTYQDYLAKGVYDGVDVRNQVFFGFGRTWNFSVRYDF
ncbi:TonB-dependent receptor [Flavobacterium luminosum]|uniref:TonB-dependent receptor n=1 Tax=Flavobacterium luminosum TaxID=2949086 RepID=A0ABT0TMC5_9FLAO|nr:TonB-dependent receptor [Flavobacterium sp. HXWNR70]MCL9808244.1 TonB-dependent receptor [Flavobacterium sp. HXWNR70]